MDVFVIDVGFGVYINDNSCAVVKCFPCDPDTDISKFQEEIHEKLKLFAVFVQVPRLVIRHASHYLEMKNKEVNLLISYTKVLYICLSTTWK
jgi:hypothetical protein